MEKPKCANQFKIHFVWALFLRDTTYTDTNQWKMLAWSFCDASEKLIVAVVVEYNLKKLQLAFYLTQPVKQI